MSGTINIFDGAVVVRRMHRDADACQSSHEPLLACPVLLARSPGSGMVQGVGATLQTLSSMRMAPATLSAAHRPGPVAGASPLDEGTPDG